MSDYLLGQGSDIIDILCSERLEMCMDVELALLPDSGGPTYVPGTQCLWVGGGMGCSERGTQSGQTERQGEWRAEQTACGQG